jgi:hypothetical protein
MTGMITYQNDLSISERYTYQTAFVYVWMRHTIGTQTQIWSFIVQAYYFTPISFFKKDHQLESFC